MFNNLDLDGLLGNLISVPFERNGEKNPLKIAQLMEDNKKQSSQLNSQLASLIMGSQNRDQSGGGALNLSQYTVPAFKGFDFKYGGSAGDPEDGDTPSPASVIIQDLGMDPYTYDRYKTMVAFHETGGTLDPKQKQVGGGPGRGLFQFERPATKTAARRIKAYFKSKGEEVPGFIEDVAKKGVDATTLNPDQQELLLAGQMMKVGSDGGVRLDKVFTGTLEQPSDFANAWFSNHNKSDSSKKKDRLNSFLRDTKTLLQQNQEQNQEKQDDAPEMTVEDLFNQITGIEKAGLGKFFKKRWDDIKKIGKGVFEGAKGVADFGLGLAGAPDLIQNSVVDKSGFLSGANNILGSVARAGLDMASPGAGTALGAIGGTANNAANQNMSKKEQKRQQEAFDNSAAGGLQQLMGLLGGQQNQASLNGLMQILGGGVGSFADGGIADAVPEGLNAIQTETYKGLSEKIVFADGSIADVNAKKAHEKQRGDEVTDVVPEGAYIASARPEMSFTADALSNILFGHKTLSYEEHSKGIMPEEMTAADILPKGKKKIKPAEYADLIRKKYPTVRREKEDMFTNAANTENLQSRIPFIQTLVVMGEKNRIAKEGGESPVFKDGGFISKYPLGGAVAVGGMALNSLAGFINQGSQRKELKNQRKQLAVLTGQLNSLNDQSTAIGIAGQLAQQTDLPELDLNFSRLENFNTATPQSFIDAAARPTNDITAMLDRLGDRAGVAGFANTQSQSMNARNQAAQNAFSQQRAADFSIAQALTQGENQETQFNNNLRQQEIAARNNVFNNIAGQMQGNLQNRANIASNQFDVDSQLGLQRAQLSGQALGNLGQNLIGAGGALESIGFEGFGLGRNRSAEQLASQREQLIQQNAALREQMNQSRLNGSTISYTPGTPLGFQTPSNGILGALESPLNKAVRFRRLSDAGTISEGDRQVLTNRLMENFFRNSMINSVQFNSPGRYTVGP